MVRELAPSSVETTPDNRHLARHSLSLTRTRAQLPGGTSPFNSVQSSSQHTLGASP